MQNLRLFVQALCLGLALLAAGCASMPVPGLPSSAAAPRHTVPFDAMPADAAVITSAVAVQTVTPPLEHSGSVRFAPGAEGPSAAELALEGFAFTGGEMHAFRPAAPGLPGLVAGRISYACPLERTAEFLYLAEYEKQGNAYLVQTLRVAPVYADTPRVQVFVLPLEELALRGAIQSYIELAGLLAERAVSPGMLRSFAGPVDVALLALSRERTEPGSELTLGISAGSAGPDGFSEGCTSSSFNGWPVAVLTGTLDPRAAGPLFAKVTFTPGRGRFVSTKLLCVHQLTGT